MGEANLLPALFAAQGVSAIGETYSQQAAIKNQDRFQRTQTGIARRRMALQEKDILKRGDREANRVGRETRRLTGAQRAAFAGQGVQVDSGTAAAIKAETELFGKLDEQTVKNSAWRQAWGIRAESEDLELESRMKSQAAKRKRRATIVTGGLRAARSGLLAYDSHKNPQRYR